ncbi:MAG: hypothetical protein M1832_003106, partial [Thelocarpon impressellum]
ANPDDGIEERGPVENDECDEAEAEGSETAKRKRPRETDNKAQAALASGHETDDCDDRYHSGRAKRARHA